jgi:hypothetical protein
MKYEHIIFILLVSIEFVGFFTWSMVELKQAKTEYKLAKVSYVGALNISSNVTGVKDIVFNCAANRTLEDLAKCLNDNVRSVFKYNVTPDNMSLSFNELTTRGGDCKDWSELYIYLGSKMGLKVEKVHIDVTENSGHAIAILGDSTGYCVMDQKSYKCWSY